MSFCRICGQILPPLEKLYLPYFFKYKKQRVQWCHDCQKMYMNMVKEEERAQKILQDNSKFSVSFD